MTKILIPESIDAKLRNLSMLNGSRKGFLLYLPTGEDFEVFALQAKNSDNNLAPGVGNLRYLALLEYRRNNPHIDFMTFATSNNDESIIKPGITELGATSGDFFYLTVVKGEKKLYSNREGSLEIIPGSNINQEGIVRSQLSKIEEKIAEQFGYLR